MKLTGDLNTPPLPMTDAEVNHLRRLLAWMRVEYMLDPDAQRGYLSGVSECVAGGWATPEQAGAIVQQASNKINRVPAYVRQGVKMLTKALRDHELASGIVEARHAPATPIVPQAGDGYEVLTVSAGSPKQPAWVSYDA